MNNKKRILYIIILLLTISLFGCSGNQLESFLNDLTLPKTTSNDLELLPEYSYKNKNILVTWESTNTSVIDNNGHIFRSEVDQDVVIIANAKYNDETKVKTFIVKVLADTDPQTIQTAINSVMMPSRISDSIKLPSTKTVSGKTIVIEWESTNQEILKNDGTVVLPKVDTTVEIKGKFKLNNHEQTKVYNILVVHDIKYDPANYYHTLQLYKGIIEGEVAPTPVQEFAGAIYRKVQSSKDNWLGIEVVVTLPEFIGDSGRTGKNTLNGVTYTRYLDNASVYLGGNSIKECDIGLTWSIGASDANCNQINYDESVAFRPFWRYIDASGVNNYKNSDWRDPRFYYYPGDTVRMSVFVSSNDKMQLRIELLKETTISKYVDKRNSYELEDNYEKVFVSPEFDAPGAGYNYTLFKRVCALDQVANESKPSQPTNAISKNIIFKECYLYRKINNEVFKVPFTSSRSSALNCPVGSNSLADFTNAIKVSYENVDVNLGGEVVIISPNNRK